MSSAICSASCSSMYSRIISSSRTSSQSSGNGQLSPAPLTRARYSPTVLRAMFRLRAILWVE